MAKESMKAREVRRAKLVAKYAEKRAALKKIVNSGDPVEAFEAAQKLQAIPKNANPIRLHLALRKQAGNLFFLLNIVRVVLINLTINFYDRSNRRLSH